MSNAKRKRNSTASTSSAPDQRPNPIRNALATLRGKKKTKSRRATVTDNENSDGEDPPTDVPLDNDAHIDLTNSADEAEDNDSSSKEAELKKTRERVAARKSHAYAFFHRDPDVEFDAGGKVQYVLFKCTICRAVVRQGATGGDAASTSGLLRHAKQCWSDDTVKHIMSLDNSTNNEELRTELQKGKKTSQSKLTMLYKPLKKTWDKLWSTLTPSKESIRVGTARMCAEEARPFNITSGRCYRWLQREGRPDRYIPPRQQISKDVKKLFEKTKAKLAAELQEYNGEFALAADCWTSPNHRACMSIEISWLRKNEHGEEEHVTHLLDFIELPVSHSGLNMAECLVEVLREFGIEDKIISITLDNATANDVMVDNLEVLLTNFTGRRAHVRCMAHTVNLVAKGILRPFEPKKKTKAAGGGEENVNDEEEDGDFGMEELLAELRDIEANGVRESDDVDGFIDVLEAMDEGEREQWLEDVKPLRNALVKARRISFKTINSTTLLLPAWHRTTSGTPFADRALPRDVATRWNSTYDMLSSFLDMRELVDTFTNTYSNGLTDFIITDDEWDAIRDLVSVLKILKEATEYFSSDGLTVSSVIPAMDLIDEKLANGIVNEADTPRQLCAPLRHAIAIGKRTLNKYYELSDSSDIYRLSMILHPAYKTTYFLRLGWDESWVNEALRVTRAAWQRFKPDETAGTGNMQASSSSTASTSGSRSNSFADLIRTQVNMAVPDLNVDELERYLNDSVVPTDKPLEWWISNRKLYPHLSRLAISVHCVMSSTVAVERSFSRGRIMISHLRNRLRANTVRALMCFGEWSRMDMWSPAELETMLKEDDGEENGEAFVDDELDLDLL